MDIKTVLIVEDNPSTLQWLNDCIKRAFNPEKILLSESVKDAKTQINESIALAIIDLHLPDGSGVEVIKSINQKSPNTLCVVATIFDDDDHIFPALQAGASGYLLKDLSQQDFISEISGIIEGRPPLSPAIARKLLMHFNQVAPDFDEDVQITAREKEVLQFLGKGLQVKKIAIQLELSHHTVGDYIKSIYKKLNICSRAEAAVEAMKRGLI